MKRTKQSNGAKWWVADLIVETVVQGDRRNVVHRNTVLVGARTAGEAYDKAISLGKENNISFDNPFGKKVKMRFRGIGHLDIIDDELEHGAEITFTERVGVPEATIKKWVKPKKGLNPFLPPKCAQWKSMPEPNFAPGSVVQEVIERGGRFPGWQDAVKGRSKHRKAK
jgi:hypothetical protein